MALNKDEITQRVEDLIDDSVLGDLTYAEISQIIVSRVHASMAARRAANLMKMVNDPAVKKAMVIVNELRRDPKNGAEILRQHLDPGEN